jgi:hypothetical protein
VRKCKKMWKLRKIVKCECNAKMESKFASHRIALLWGKFFAFSHFFASHLHRTTIPTRHKLILRSHVAPRETLFQRILCLIILLQLGNFQNYCQTLFCLTSANCR